MRIAGLKHNKQITKRTKAQREKLRRENRINRILSKVDEMCNYAIKNLCTQPAQFEELEWMLNDCVK